MKTALCFAVVLALLAVSNIGLAQDQNSPENVVKLLKQYVDFGTIYYLPMLYTDMESQGPLQVSSYSALIENMEGIWSEWANRTFVICNQEEISPSLVAVSVSVPETNEQVKFYARSFGGLWYIDGIEIRGAK